MAQPFCRTRSASARNAYTSRPPSRIVWLYCQSAGSNAAAEHLSYGCSTGEEVFSLAQYLPQARIKGVDINRHCLRVAHRALQSHKTPHVSFAHARSPTVEPTAFYDAVFCLSVLRHGKLEGERPENSSKIMPFARFAGAIAALDRVIKPGGYLILWGSHFRFADTPQYSDYTPVLTLPDRSDPSPLYGPDNCLLTNKYFETIFCKRALGIE